MTPRKWMMPYSISSMKKNTATTDWNCEHKPTYNPGRGPLECLPVTDWQKEMPRRLGSRLYRVLKTIYCSRYS
jgi:hypothetical protein